MSAKRHTIEDFLNGIKKNPEAADKLLTAEFKFTEPGLISFFEEHTVAASIFLGDFIGVVFDIKNDNHIASVLKKGRGEDEDKAKIMHFLYSIKNFGDESSINETEETKTGDTRKPPEEKGEHMSEEETSVQEPTTSESTETKTARKSLSNETVPFRAGTLQSEIFKKMLEFSGTKQELLEAVGPLIETYGKAGVNHKMVMNNTITMANKRGYTVTFGEDGSMSVTKDA